MKQLILILISITIINNAIAQKISQKTIVKDTIYTNINGNGYEIIIEFNKGKKHSHPIFAFWIEDMNENFIQSLYVSRTIATGYFEHGQEKEGKWAPGDKRRPAALPYWSHKRGIKAKDGLFTPDKSTKVADAYTGATPKSNFVLYTKTDKSINTKFKLVFEINQAFDWNDYWFNNKFPNDEDYKTSSQPALVYSVTIDPNCPTNTYYMNPIGHSHYSGKDGKLYTNLSTLTTAMQIVESIKITLIKK